MDKEEFKARWETEDGGGITFDDIAECAIEWGLFSSPRTLPIFKVANAVMLNRTEEQAYSIAMIVAKKHFQKMPIYRTALSTVLQTLKNDI